MSGLGYAIGGTAGLLHSALMGWDLHGGTKMRKAAMVVLAAVCSICVSGFALAASLFEGVWKVKDTAGHPFEIALSGGGVAKVTRGERMTGTWKEEGDSAVMAGREDMIRSSAGRSMLTLPRPEKARTSFGNDLNIWGIVTNDAAVA